MNKQEQDNWFKNNLNEMKKLASENNKISLAGRILLQNEVIYNLEEEIKKIKKENNLL
jgi:hypothetical protein